MLNEMFGQLKSLFDSGGLNENFILEKFQEAMDKIPNEVKDQLKEQNIDLNSLLLQYLTGGNGDEESENENKGRKKRNKKG